MKLELKHLTPYLPYELQGEVLWTPMPNQGTRENRTEIGSLSLKVVERWHDQEAGLYLPIQNKGETSKKYMPVKIKPILRPLSDLTKEIEHNGKKFVPIKVFAEGIDYENNILMYIQNTRRLIMNFEHSLHVYNHLLEWHFDVFSLIENNLAIDKNTVESLNEE